MQPEWLRGAGAADIRSSDGFRTESPFRLNLLKQVHFNATGQHVSKRVVPLGAPGRATLSPRE